MLDLVVDKNKQEIYREALVNNQPLPILEFKCPKCSLLCSGYQYDNAEMEDYKRNFIRGCYTYILIDKSSSMSVYFADQQSFENCKGEPRTRFEQTKEIVKQLLKNISKDAGSMDKFELNTFDENLTKPSVIPRCNAKQANNPENQERIDSINLQRYSVGTHFFETLMSVYDLLDRLPFHTIRLYILSDGKDTSKKSRDNERYCEYVQSLQGRLGVCCRVFYTGNESLNDIHSRFSWLVGREHMSIISGSRKMIHAECARICQEDYEATKIPSNSGRTSNRSNKKHSKSDGTFDAVPPMTSDGSALCINSPDRQKDIAPFTIPEIPYIPPRPTTGRYMMVTKKHSRK